MNYSHKMAETKHVRVFMMVTLWQCWDDGLSSAALPLFTFSFSPSDPLVFQKGEREKEEYVYNGLSVSSSVFFFKFTM